MEIQRLPLSTTECNKLQESCKDGVKTIPNLKVYKKLNYIIKHHFGYKKRRKRGRKETPGN